MTTIVFTENPQNYSPINTSEGMKNPEPQMAIPNEQNPSLQLPDGYTLGEAVENNDLEGVKYLMEKEVRRPWGCGNALTWAAKKGHYEIVKYLIEFKDKSLPEEKYKDLPIAKILQKRGDYWYVEQALKEAVNNNQIEVVVYLLKQRIGKFSKVLAQAAKIGNQNMVKCLVEQISNLTRIKKGALDEAAYKAVLEGYLDILKYLVEQGANIHAIHETMYYKQQDNALIAACKLGNLEIVKYLVNQGADIHAQNDAALYRAAFNGHFAIVKYLVEQGADIYVQDERPLKVACEHGHLAIVKLFSFHE